MPLYKGLILQVFSKAGELAFLEAAVKCFFADSLSFDKKFFTLRDLIAPNPKLGMKLK